MKISKKTTAAEYASVKEAYESKAEEFKNELSNLNLSESQLIEKVESSAQYDEKLNFVFSLYRQKEALRKRL